MRPQGVGPGVLLGLQRQRATGRRDDHPSARPHAGRWGSHVRLAERGCRSHLRCGNERRGLLLGLQRRRRAGRRHDYPAARPQRGRRWPHVRVGQCGRRSIIKYGVHLRRDLERRGVLLGHQLLRPAGRRHPDPAARPHGGRRGAHVHHAERGCRSHLRPDDERRGVLLGLQRRWPAGR